MIIAVDLNRGITLADLQAVSDFIEKQFGSTASTYTASDSINYSTRILCPKCHRDFRYEEAEDIVS
jgi:hypothetical protein